MKDIEILKSKLEGLLRDLPEKVDVEDVMYRLYLLQKIEAGEKDVAEGRTISHKDVLERLISLGLERFSRMYLDRSAWDDGTARTVEQALAETDPAKTVASKFKKELGKYTDSQLARAW